ncbi:MAG: ribonuclease R [Oscillospiraceae bacterium]|nr:ribonuclease R [Oscillospiraceae bacterium]
MAEQKDIYRNRIKSILTQGGGKGVPYKKLYASCKGRRQNAAAFAAAIAELKREGVITEDKIGIKLCSAAGLFRATISRLNKTFGFIEREDGTEVFVPGKFLKGAMPGDTVMARLLPPRGELPEGEVVSVVEEGFTEFSGTVEKEGNTICIRPDTLSKDLMIVSAIDVPVRVGDKVLAEIYRRGERHSEHRVRIKAIFGDSGKAKSSADALLYTNGIETEFPSQVLDEARTAEHKGIPFDELYKRLDLRDEIIFTIDGADTKDIDDAVSVSRDGDGWRLGVHIADVSFYVKAGSELDANAMLRGTSIYYANKVVPMLPKELSNGICSLNPQEDRLAFSCLMKLDGEGKLIDYKFSKTVIRSRVKGVYSEINTLLDGIKSGEGVSPELAEKYDGLTGTILRMDELAAILTANKLRRGAPQIETSESKLIIDENDVCVDVQRRERGRSELIIEEFMLMANTAAARLAKEAGIPFVYRVHEDPAPEKIGELVETVSVMGIAVPRFTSVKPKHLAEILEKTKDSPLAPVVNSMVLRSMAKAKYSDEPLGHFGLVLDDYAHFTSPIRRYPDLAIHRILTDLCYNKKTPDQIRKRYAAFANEAARQSSERELVAMRIERSCDDCYAAEYMSAHIGEHFEGMISSVQEFGFFVELPNTVEGLVRLDTLKNGPYDYDGRFALTKEGKPVYRVGDKINVICAAANVSAGQVDFVVEGDCCSENN